MKTLTALLVLVSFAASAVADVVRPAPDFGWELSAGKTRSLKSLRGQPVVVVFARSADTRAFRRQVRNLKEIYQQFASRNVIFVAALKEDGGRIPSDVPFVRAVNGAQVAAEYGVRGGGFALAVIGRDGNLDLITDDVKSAARIRDVIINSYEPQKAARK